ncbi:MAG: tetratricopeptide repeat protein [Deltaproteobacteria bacterium]|nr:tetratricopeptide repeat protein [Deltaproteobacteria bacterium]
MPGARRGPNDTLPTLPRLESTYSRIIERAIQAVREERGLAGKLRGVTRQMAALGGHTRQQFRELPPAKRAGVSLGLLVVGAALALVAYHLLFRASPDELRRAIAADIAASRFVAAKHTLDELSARTGGLSPDDRWKLAAPIQAWTDKRASELLEIIEARRRTKRWDDALAALLELEQLGVEIELALFTHAEVLRAAGRREEAAEYYARYARIFPATHESDDALFWQALMHKELGEDARSRVVLRELLEKYPRSNFATSGKRLLGELNSAE